MSLRHALLGMLNQHPASGYDLLKLFDTSLANIWPATQSQIYTELTRLADAELISASATGPRGRKEYTITGEGRAELRRWLTETQQPPQAVRNDTLLRVFLLGALTKQQAVDYLKGLAEEFARRHDELGALREHIDWDGDDLSVHGGLVLEFGLRFHAMRRDWARWAAGQLD